MKLSSGVLYYIVFVLLITWFICISILLVFKLNHIVFHQTLISNTLNDDLQSALNIVCANPESANYNDSMTFALENRGISTIIVRKKHWGYLNIIDIKVSRGKQEKRGIFLAGYDLSMKEPIALYMADENKYLSVCGNTVLKGTCYLPRMGVKRGYIEGSTFKGKVIVQGAVKKSSNGLPDIDPEASKTLLSYLRDFKPDTFAEIRSMKEFNSKYKHVHPFSQKPIAYCTEKPLYIDGKTLKGNIIICSSKLIKISRSNSISDLIIIAPKIIISEGFKGSLQVFATDSIVIQKNSKLAFPSVVALLSENVSNLFMNIEEKSRIDGIVVLNQFSKAQSRPLLIIGNKTEIFGQVYCNGTINTNGDFYGSLHCINFMLNTRSAIYENHLLHTKIDRSKLSEFYCGAAIADSGKNCLAVIKEL